MKPGLVIGVVIMLALAGAGVVWLLLDSSSPAAPVSPTSPSGEPSGAGPEGATPGRTSAHDAIRPRPFAATDEASPVREGGLLVTVVDTSDHVVMGAIVASCNPSAAPPQSKQDISQAVTGTDGSARVRLDAPVDVAHLIVLAPSHTPALVRVSDQKQQRIRLEGEALLRGKVVVNGAVPPAPLSFKVTGFIDPSRGWSESVQRLIGLLQAEPSSTLGPGGVIPFDSNANGDFAVFGLTRGEIASIEIPDGYVFADPKPDLHQRARLFDCDGAPILLELSALNVLTGRIVRSSKSGAAVTSDPPDLEVRYTLQLPRPGGATAGDVSAKLGSTFGIGFLEPALTSVTLDIWDSGYPRRRIGQKKFEQTITGSKDLGDIVLGEPVTVTFLLIDPGGQPVSKGRVLAAGVLSPETGTDGRTKLGLYPGTRGVVVGAPRFRIEGVPLPESPPSAMEVQLRPASTLVVRVRHEDPSEALRGLKIAISYDVNDIVAAAEASPEFMDVCGERSTGALSRGVSGPFGPGVYGRSSGGHQTHLYEVESGHDVLVSGFQEGDEVKVSLQDRSGYPLIEETVRLGDAETKAMELVVRSKPKSIRLTVVDEKSRPLAGARVKVGDGFPSGSDLECDASGRFELPNVYGPEPMVLVTAPGHVAKSVHAPEIFQAPTIVLESGRQLAVRLTGASSGSMHGNVTFEVTGGETFTAMQRGEDVYVFEAIPRRAGTVRVQGRKATSSAAVGAEETRVDIARPE
jgi:hypothetical protein